MQPMNRQTLSSDTDRSVSRLKLGDGSKVRAACSVPVSNGKRGG